MKTGEKDFGVGDEHRIGNVCPVTLRNVCVCHVTDTCKKKKVDEEVGILVKWRDDDCS